MHRFTASDEPESPYARAPDSPLDDAAKIVRSRPNQIGVPSRVRRSLADISLDHMLSEAGMDKSDPLTPEQQEVFEALKRTSAKNETLKRHSVTAGTPGRGHRRTATSSDAQALIAATSRRSTLELNIDTGARDGRHPSPMQLRNSTSRSSVGSGLSPRSTPSAHRNSAKTRRLLVARSEKRLYASKLILRYTTISEDGTCFPPVVIDASGASFGRSRENKISVPNDDSLIEVNHARIYPDGGVFFIEDCGARHGVSMRVTAGPGLHDWPLDVGAVFVAGLTEFTVVKAEPTQLEITITGGPAKGQQIVVTTSGVTIGRSTENSCTVADKELSRKHCCIQYHESQFYLCDVGSTNGSYVRMCGPYQGRLGLQFGDHIMVGKTAFSVNRFDFGVSEEMGHRPSMEDRTVVVQDLAVSALGPLGLGPQTFAAVFDGHGGTAASTFLWQKLHHNIATALRKGLPNIDAILGSLNVQLASTQQLRSLDEYMTKLLKRVFVDTDREFVRTSKHPNAGSTCTSVLILGSRIYCANVGDSRTIMRRNGRIEALSVDHTPAREDEEDRIQRAGGFVLYKRVMGELAVSRAFGDAEFKNYNYTKTRPKGTASDSGRNDDGSTTSVTTPQRSMSVAETEHLSSGPSLSEQVRDLMTPSSTRAKPPRTRRRTQTGDESSETGSDLPAGLSISISEPLSTPSSMSGGVRHRMMSNGAGVLPEASPASVSKQRKGLQVNDRRTNASMFALPATPDPLPSPGARSLSARHLQGRHSIAEQTPVTGRAKATSQVDTLTILTCSSDDQSGVDLVSPSAICERCIVTAEPEVTVHTLDEQADDFILLACDGLYDVFSNELCAATVVREYRRARDAQVVAERLTHKAVSELNSRDNVSVIFLALRDASLWI